MTIAVSQERSTLSLPGARLGSEDRTVRAGPNGVSSQSQHQVARPAVAVAPSAAADVGALRAMTSGLDRASSVTDAALGGANAVIELLTQLRDSAAAEQGKEFVKLLGRIDEIAQGAEFDGVNLLDGSTPGGALRVNGGDSGEIAITAPDLRPGGPRVTVSAEADPAGSLNAIDASLANVQSARDGLRQDSKGLEAHRSFVVRLADAIGDEAAPLDVEGARLAALSIKQTLAGTTLSLAAGGPKTVLSLFR